ncbi:MFS transporter [uncultured Jatrophihabitans sp.]|uniref:MFS transporter n=1 Tax=uncultured Jatrophihabitans sp. TaxID=1610747 RepID=UPI0035C9F94C
MIVSRSNARSAALGAVLSVLFLTFLDTTIVSVALGNLAGDVSAGVIPLQWVINAYALAFAALMLTGGSLADRFGRKRLMLVGIAVFCVGSLMCALASGVALVIAGRAVMGVGAAAAEPGTLSVIRQLYPHRAQRARALGAWSAVSGLALALGPVLGGLLVDAGGWRSIFWFNLAAGSVLAVWVFAVVPESADRAAGRLDAAGLVLGAAGVGCVVFAAISGEYQGYGAAWVVALFVVGGGCLLAFVPVERRVQRPMLDPTYFREPIVRAALFAAFAVYFGVFALFFLTALYLDIGQQYSGARLAAMFAPMAAAIVVGGVAAGRWVARSGSRPPMAIGCGIAALGMLLARAELGAQQRLDFALLSLALALAGLGFGVTVVPLTSAVLSHVPARHSGIAASATNTARQLGAVVGVAALGAIVNAHLTATVNREFTGTLLGPSRKPVLKILETGGSGVGFSLDQIPQVFVIAFVDGVRVALVVATVLVLLAGLAAALVREPADAELAPEVS